jgi:hypothetical protein
MHKNCLEKNHDSYKRLIIENDHLERCSEREGNTHDPKTLYNGIGFDLSMQKFSQLCSGNIIT